jgi:hypothetical protein
MTIPHTQQIDEGEEEQGDGEPQGAGFPGERVDEVGWQAG